MPLYWALSLAPTLSQTSWHQGRSAGAEGAASAMSGHCREEIADTVLNTFKTACDPWGVTVERVEVGDSSNRSFAVFMV